MTPSAATVISNGLYITLTLLYLGCIRYAND
jgi:hypothetical protein